MSKREERVINAFVNCVKSGEFSLDYATTLIEDQQKYGWLSEQAKDRFYAETAEPVTIQEPDPLEPMMGIMGKEAVK